MIKNYFKTAWRNLLKNKTFSFINISGLSIGIAAFLLIVHYLRFEYSFDTFNANKDRIYRVPMMISETNGKPQAFAFTFPSVAPAMKKDFPEIEEVVRFRKRWGVMQHEDQKIFEEGMIYYVDPAVFKVFSFPFEKGDAASAFTELNDAVITHSTAQKYFGNENPVGKLLHYDHEDYKVTAVLKEIPANSHLQFHVLLNYNKYIQITGGRANDSWTWSDFYTYLLLKPGTDAAALQKKMPAFAERYMADLMKTSGYNVSFNIQPLKDIHTKSDYDYEMAGSGNLSYLKYLGIAALFILLIALINYVNLSTAHSLERSKEVGVRKVVGASKQQLVRQFLAETFLVNMIAIVLGIVFFKLSLPFFARLISQDAAALQTTSWAFWLGITALFIISTLVAGFYPAFVLSSFRPVQTLKSAAGVANVKDKAFFRKTLVILQYSIAIILIGSAIGFYKQLKFMSSRDLGINIDQTLVLKQTVDLDSSKIALVEKTINDLQQIPGVEYVTTSTDVPGGEVGSTEGFRLLSSNDDKRCRTFGIDELFIPHFGLSILAGRNFDKDVPFTNDSTKPVNVIVNETAARVFGFAKPSEAVNQVLKASNGATCKIVGVMNDYHQQSFRYNYDPVIYYPNRHINMGNFSLKLKTSNIEQVIERAKQTWSAAFPQSPLQYFFLDEFFNRQYKDDQLFSTVLWWFTVLAIIIANLGLLGLSLYSIAKRTKEIGIRKVLGANIAQITALVTRDYIKLMLYAGLIAIPVAYLLLQNWLKDYAFHISIGLWFFFLPLLLIMFVAFVTVVYQAIKAASANPVKSLRTE
ncbi:ABC transporter permease [Pinibacter aurantiacus]|uniref:ABC transporter permease n=1 Tax=Pinibacter aurantiacus TaxID=2851599 RepID=A0A9E2SDB4_9BACT|nr:ABC transporter permease [Pinibacter aurantiacus]MBV4359272.1 ABC transporter permease [Pinibacter aurantiacus]